MRKNTFKYEKNSNILNKVNDEYKLSEEEIAFLYDFYVINSVYSGCYKKKDLKEDYGWEIKELKSQMKNIINIDEIFYSNSNNYKNIHFCNSSYDLVCILNNDQGNAVLSFLTYIRHALCHSCFRTVYSVEKKKMILFQTNDNNNVTSRGIIKLDTLFAIANLISKQNK